MIMEKAYPRAAVRAKGVPSLSEMTPGRTTMSTPMKPSITAPSRSAVSRSPSRRGASRATHSGAVNSSVVSSANVMRVRA